MDGGGRAMYGAAKRCAEDRHLAKSIRHTDFFVFFVEKLEFLG